MGNLLLLLLALFIVVPLVELALLFQLAALTDWRVTLLIVVATGVIGTLLARAQGFRTVQRIREELSAGRLPSTALMDAVMILVAGGVLLTPGLLTDLFGLSLLIPVFRRWYRGWISRWIKANFTLHSFVDTEARQAPPNDSKVIDSYVVDPEGDEDASR